jgi:hypothetical protein
MDFFLKMLSTQIIPRNTALANPAKAMTAWPLQNKGAWEKSSHAPFDSIWKYAFSLAFQCI